MSYILDALRKAEADRKLGETAGVHDPAPVAAADLAVGSAGLHRWLPGVAVGLLLGLTGTLAWMLMSGSDDTPPSATAQAPAPGHDLPAMTQVQQQTAAPSTLSTGDDTVVQLPRPASPPAQPKSTVSAVNPLTQSATEASPRKLTPELRANLPPLAVGGAMYSEVAASRMVVINGQLYREGDTVAPGVTLEQIQLKSAILRHQGQRYQLDY